MQETWVLFLTLEDPLEKEMATHSSILAWRIPWTPESGGLQTMGCKESGRTEATEHAHTWMGHCPGGIFPAPNAEPHLQD